MIEQLSSEWHPKNKITLTEDKLGSHKKVWWICKKGHEYESAIRNRVNGSQCPYCSGKLAIVGETDLKTTHPHLIEEWNFEKNTIYPNELKAKSNKKVWWKCFLNHEWESTPNNRTSQTSGCPYCANKKLLTGYNDAKSVYPQYEKEYDIDKNIEQYNEIFLNTKKKYWWICELGHSYESAGEKKVLGKGCPYCANRKILKGFNDLESQYPELAEQWDYEKNVNLVPSEVVFGSYKKAWWKCKNNHTWNTSIFFRTTHIRKSGCPDCSKRVSKGEQEVRKFAESILQEQSLNNNRKTIAPYELDIYFPKKKIAIEFNGTYWHSDIQIRKSRNMSAEDYHNHKINKCREKGITLLIVWQDDWEHNADIVKRDIEKALLNNNISSMLRKTTSGEKEE